MGGWVCACVFEAPLHTSPLRSVCICAHGELLVHYTLMQPVQGSLCQAEFLTVLCGVHQEYAARGSPQEGNDQALDQEQGEAAQQPKSEATGIQSEAASDSDHQPEAAEEERSQHQHQNSHDDTRAHAETSVAQGTSSQDRPPRASAHPNTTSDAADHTEPAADVDSGQCNAQPQSDRKQISADSSVSETPRGAGGHGRNLAHWLQGGIVYVHVIRAQGLKHRSFNIFGLSILMCAHACLISLSMFPACGMDQEGGGGGGRGDVAAGRHHLVCLLALRACACVVTYGQMHPWGALDE